MLVNILGGLQGGRVLLETPFAGFIPDIALYAEDADMPSCVIEVVHTSSPSAVKLDAMKRRRIEVYRLNAYDKNPLTILKEPVLVQGLVTRRCGKSLRKEISALAQAWTDAQWPFVGIRTITQAERKNTSMVNTTTMEMSNGNVESLKFAP